MKTPAPAPDQSSHSVDSNAFSVPLFRRILWLLVLANPLATVFLSLLNPPLAWHELYPLPALLTLTGLASLWLLRKGRPDAAMNCFLWGNALCVLFQCSIALGVRSPVTMVLPLLTVLSAWGGQRRQATLLTITVIVVLFLMTVFDADFWSATNPRPASVHFVILLFSIICGSLLAHHLGDTLRSQLTRLNQTRSELEQRLSDLQVEQAKFSTFFYLNPVPVSISLLADGTYYDLNPAWERISGWRKEEVIGRSSIEIGIWPDLAERDAWVAEFHAEGRLSNRLTRFRLRDGKIRFFLASAEIIQYEGKRCIFSAFVDVTERRDAEEKLRVLNTSLETRVAERTQSLAEANQTLAQTVESLQRTQSELVHAETMASLGTMVAGISHELNTPIGNALTVSTALQDQVREFSQRIERGDITRQTMHNFLADQRHGADLAAQNMLRAAELITSFKQVAVDQTSERRRGFELASTLGDILNTLRPMLKHQPVELRTDIANDIAMDSFPGPLGQVVNNLVQNAVLHGLGGSGGVIEIVSRPIDDERVEILVRDNGRGIPAEHLARIFDPFFTTRLGQGGSGLGLSIVHRLVSSVLGGSISVHSVEGEGCCFRVDIPRIAPRSDEA